MIITAIMRILGRRSSNRASSVPKHEPAKRAGTRDGMTLLEVMFASGILLMLVTGLLKGFTSTRRSAFMAADQMTAVHTARKAIETLNNYGVDNTNLSIGQHVIPNLGMSNLYWVTANATYPSTKDIKVTVYWRIIEKTNLMSLSYSTSLAQCLHPGI
jgi:type II secretory pathway pseudopilin PulG